MTKKNIFIVKLNYVDCLTLSGLIFASISAGFALANQFSFSLSFLFIAMLADAFDGVFARRYGTERDFGRYLDGFIDVFDYLVVPSLFLYCWGFNTWYYIIVLFLFMTTGVIRLSVFNEIGNTKNENNELSYLGMPVFWSALFLGIIYIAGWTIDKDYLFPAVAVLFAVFAILMVYNGKFYKFKSWKTMLLVILGGSIIFALDGFSLFNVKKDILPFLTNEHFITALLIIIPAMIGGIIHMLAVTKDWFKFLKIPICSPLFGENKTLRGFILMPLFSIPGGLLAYSILTDSAMTIDITATHWALFGALAGFAYILFELPNSFIKRRMGIPAGGEAGRFRLLFVILDQLDSSLGGAVLALIYFDAPMLTALSVLILGPIIALTVKKLLYVLRLKKTAA